ncbi:hypothetical protein GLOTRDRAFT_139779 [Gloeophyllum trabeum ATCC 11539]|uniref:BHLH domain-containing protein n=1 Tax=Gloeophyllum trabeum (strain ATCC 11539 / FP-39264 / Madison 617) TaxID=670483 RepID=S7Q0X8_GLOTA|nr:uncharacterized protein GLOTRDRAFT_139779 [Gloeophyllum trabeum ATCC 11539]EPQ53596.1 hypothetical protein GLOTRDRAFT_139779 [Gloeophyllum trabeum ATCC 11539]
MENTATASIPGIIESGPTSAPPALELCGMDDLASSSSWSASEPQPQSDLLDPSDPLNLILNNMSASGDSSMEDSSSSSHSSPPDWSELSALWTNPPPEQDAAENAKFAQDVNMDFNFSFPMDLDFNPASSIDPSALHFNYNAVPPLNFPVDGFLSAQDLLNVPFPATLQPGGNEGAFPFSGIGSGARRLSVTSSSSSSGASLSPILEHNSPVEASPQTTPTGNPDAAEELANKVRQAAGVTLAVPVSAQMQQAMVSAIQAPQPKLPIPRLPRPNTGAASKMKRVAAKPSPPSTASTSRSSTSSPPPSTTESTSSLPSPASALPALSTGRGKTSHTTIERRYRTNLNARIQSLRRAVPALRVLEQKEGKVDFGDVVDERGFVDGVRVARKTSKASILGKAVEYIRVLKKREGRLKREQDGLRCLICGLVGGPALLKEWEREWREKFGGEERDEVEGDEAESEDDDSEGDEEEGEGRAKKRARVAKPAQPKKEKKPAAPKAEPVVGGEGVVPEKRKRGRPRKVPAPAPEPVVAVGVEVPLAPAPAPAEAGVQKQEEPVPQSQGQGQQYLLAAFAFFSFFNSPLTTQSSAGQHHTHTGTVLSPVPHPAHAQGGVAWREVVQGFHLLVSALVFLSIVLPWLPAAVRRSKLSSLMVTPFSIHAFRSSTQSRIEEPVRNRRRERSVSKSGRTTVALTKALAHANRGTPHEAARLRAALGVYDGVVGLVQSVFVGRKKGGSYEARQAEQRAWGRLGELVVLDGTKSVATRLQTYFCMRLQTPYFKASASDLCTLALIIHPVVKSSAQQFWARALQAEFIRPYERLVLETMTVDEAAERLIARRKLESGQEKRAYWASTPLRVLAEVLLCERLRRDSATLFVRTVLRKGQKAASEYEDEKCSPAAAWDPEEEMVLEKERRRTVDAGKSLGGLTAELSEYLEKIWETGYCSLEALDADGRGASTESSAELEAEVRPLIRALMLYRQIFPSCLAGSAGEGSISLILSPPPSPSRKNPGLHKELRDTLGSGVFENLVSGQYASGEAKLSSLMEDARDLVVDMIVASERARRGH